ncbi:MAG: TIGR02186 family protein [Alphaproteobacteria bacterium]|nr:TIGR02186 family protein [Alphaproteobacteria bacterium]
MIAALAIVCGLAPAARAETLAADLSAHQITLAAGAAGAVTLFGTIDAPGDIVVVVRGPEADATVSRGPFGNFWLTAHRIVFAGVPDYYAVYASAPLDAIVPPAIQAQHQIGLANLGFQLQSVEQPPALVEESRAALIAERKRAGVYVDAVGKVQFVGDHLFRATLGLPADARAGAYFVEVLLLRDKVLVGGQTMSLTVATTVAKTKLVDSAGGGALPIAAFAAVAAIAAAGAALWLRRRRRGRRSPPAVAAPQRLARRAKRAKRR